MRFKNLLVTSAGALLTSLAAPFAILGGQGSAVRVDVHTPESNTIWYADPFWIAVGGVALLIILVLAVMASRRGKTTTTIVR
jgi:formate-dependent nitrite reductase membrane component NrfD